MISIKQVYKNFKEDDIKREIANMFEKNGKEIGEEAVSFFRSSFSIKGFINKTINKWKPAKKSTNHTLMIDTGALERSIRVGKISKNKIEIVSDGLDYNVYQNEQRQFMGESKLLENKIKKTIENILDKIS